MVKNQGKEFQKSHQNECNFYLDASLTCSDQVVQAPLLFHLELHLMLP